METRVCRIRISEIGMNMIIIMYEVNHSKEYMFYIRMGLKGWGIDKKYNRIIRSTESIKKWVIVLSLLRLIGRLDLHHRLNRYLKEVRIS